MARESASRSMGLNLQYAQGSTPLDPDETEGLIPEHITTQGQLNEWEAENILKGKNWAFSKKRSDLLTDGFLRELHREMFNDTWKWAGTYRKTEKSIGIAPEKISVSVRDIMANVAYMVERKVCTLDEIAIRLHHQLVVTHPFPNGNGRVTRLIADLFQWTYGGSVFTWGGGANLVANSTTRDLYISTLKAADQGDIMPLLAFAKS